MGVPFTKGAKWGKSKKRSKLEGGMEEANVTGAGLRDRLLSCFTEFSFLDSRGIGGSGVRKPSCEGKMLKEEEEDQR